MDDTPQMFDGLPDLLTIPEAAAALRVSETTVRRLIRSGELRAAKIGRGRGTYRLTKPALVEWLRQLEGRDDDGAPGQG